MTYPFSAGGKPITAIVPAEQSGESFFSRFRRKRHGLTPNSEILLDNTVFVYYNQIHIVSVQGGGPRVAKNRNRASPIQAAGYRRGTELSKSTASQGAAEPQRIGRETR